MATKRTAPKGPSGSKDTASGDPGSVMREEGGLDAYEDDFRRHYRDTYGEGERAYTYYEPAYHLGHRYGTTAEYGGRDYEALEPEMRRRYEEEHKGTWAHVQGAARHAFTSSRSRAGSDRPSSQ